MYFQDSGELERKGGLLNFYAGREGVLVGKKEAILGISNSWSN